MELTPLILAGRAMGSAADLLQIIAYYAFIGIISGIVLLLILRWVTDAFHINPFGRFSYYTRRPTNEMLYQMRNSSLYYPLKRAFGFDPAVLMLLIGAAIVCYVVYKMITNLALILWGVGNVLINFGQGAVGGGVWRLIGVALLGVIFFLMSLMTLIFVYSIFGLFRRASYWSMQRIGPLLRIFEFGGAFPGLSFIILWIALMFAAEAVIFIFRPIS